MKRWLAMVLLGAAFAEAVNAAPPPAWVEELVVPANVTSGAVAEVLLCEHRVSVPAAGRITHTERGAIILRESAGRHYMACMLPYEQGTSEVRQLRAWLVLPRAGIREFEKSDALDFSLLGAGVLASDQRALRLSAADAPVGAIFAYEWTLKQEPLVAQWYWSFGAELPVLRSRFELELPAGAEVRAVGAPRSVETTHQDNRWSWEMRSLAAVRETPQGGASTGSDQILRLSVLSHRAGVPAGAEFASWQEVGNWAQRLSDPQSAPSELLVNRTRALTAGLTDPLAQARAIGAFVQNTNYIALNLGLGFGFGYRPRPATEVLTTGYGDCKDKANLVKAMLQAVGQQAWLVAVYAGDRHHVVDEWPTVRQFNHCIVALQAPRLGAFAAADPDSPLGPILYFDPTDPCTGFGELPATLQGSYGLLQTAQASGLIRLPIAREGAYGTKRSIHATLGVDGSLKGEWVETVAGQEAAEVRCRRRQGEQRLRSDDEATLARAMQRVDISGWTALDDPDSSRFERRIAFQAPGFARHSGATLMSFTAGVLPLGTLPALGDTGSTAPLDLDPTAFAAVVILKLPVGWTVDELPKDRRVEQDFGLVEATWKVDGGVLEYQCRVRTQPVRLPAVRAEEVRGFFDAVRAVQGAPIVLVRQ